MIIGEWEESERIASLKGWTWKSGKGFEIDATITEQEIDMTGRLNDTGAIDDLVENMTKVKKENFKNLIDEVDQRKIDDNTKRYFIKLYYNMTPAQIEVFNREYDSTKMRLKKKMSSKEVIDYVIRSEEKGLLKEMVHYIRELFE